MYKRGAPSRLIRAALVVMSVVSFAGAHEPDGHVAIRYAWVDQPGRATGKPVLHLTMTAVVPLKNARVVMTLPAGIDVALLSGGNAAAWPGTGMEIGDVAAGQTIAIDLDVVPPAKGGGFVGFALEGEAGGRKIHEGIGVPVGTPGAEPSVHDGLVEYPAGHGAPAP